ncbi:MAG: ROK family protein [Alistipes sp.]|nr:ROK family protein [Candidatus Alistipes equi]
MIRTNSSALLLDVGGTFIKACFLPSLSSFEKGVVSEFSVNSDGTSKEILASFSNLQKWAEQLAVDANRPIGYVAVAIPGPFDYKQGVFLMQHKFKSVYGQNFRDLLHFDTEDVVYYYIHDVNCMLLGEMSSLEMNAYRNIALVTLGTGLGFSMSLDGEILLSDKGSPRRSIYNMPCLEGGVLEDYVSKRGFLSCYMKLTGESNPSLTVKDIAQKATMGDNLAIRTFEEVAHTLCSYLRDLLEEYEIEALLFGGQISRSFFLMESAIRKDLLRVGPLRKISAVSDISNATFRGLESLLIESR